ncbi:putative polysaccharide biosynthesis protein [Companilactobacillus mishanensis]|uniref:Polysaccharide biosynthesis protein n=1 Tax=Companilactobacillus mishanensis TaxID=2486008 RepID=A0ABW9P7E4_9LACO|nr:polysaccharide biosynthesis protein [Companilactobacillus mishanensis]MQS45134.1 polysaccharide biosynthesis protein [Companilactobacillus mishanensis]MQS90197.1 polysaccharide biosynthesis protein [Companilactobacillus mishanensis]
MKKDSLLKSSLWISLSGIFSRVLAVVYIIPWNIWIGAGAGLAYVTVANAIYAKVYNIYNLFLIIATAGIPSAISKEVAAQNSIGQYDQSEKILKKYSIYMTLIGVVLAAIMFFGAKYVSIIFAAGDTRVITPIKYLSIALLVIPALGILRGYIQGYALISLSAFSQVIEQIARVAYMLYTTYTIMIISKGSYLDAINQSTLASFIGATLAYIFLLWIRHRARKNLPETKVTDEALRPQISFNGMLKSAIPFLLVDTIMVVLQLFDQTTFSWIYEFILHASKHTIDNLFGMFGFQANKLIMVLVSLAISVSASIIPALSALISRKSEKKQIQNLMRNIVEFTIFIILPATFGMIAISRQLWTLFYVPSFQGTYILIVSCAEAIFYCIFMILENILQVTHHVKKSMYYLGIAYLIKMVLQLPLTVYLAAYGPLLASTIAFMVMGHFAFRLLNKEYDIVDKALGKRLIIVAVNSLIMLVLVGASVFGITFMISDAGKVGSGIVLTIGAVIGIIVYALLSYKTGALQILKKIRNTEIY